MKYFKVEISMDENEFRKHIQDGIKQALYNMGGTCREDIILNDLGIEYNSEEHAVLEDVTYSMVDDGIISLISITHPDRARVEVIYTWRVNNITIQTKDVN